MHFFKVLHNWPPIKRAIEVIEGTMNMSTNTITLVLPL